MQIISGGGAFTNKNIADINANFSLLGAGFTPGNVIYCQPASGFTGQQDGSVGKPYTSFLAAYAALRSGYNDVLVLVGNGAAAGSARLSAGFTWAKDAAHLIGVCAPAMVSPRARIAPVAGTTAFANFFTVSGNGCIFKDIEFFQGFDTGTTAEICMTVTGGRNYFQGCHFAGMGDAASAQDAGSRNLKISGTGENTFDSCVVGIDTVTRTVANASVEFAGATPRNVFRDCLFPIMTSNAGVLGILGTGAGCVDRFNIFVRCVFMNAIKSTSTQMTVLGSFTSASPGGMVVFQGCASVGSTKYGDANFLANAFVDMAAVSGSAGGLMVAPS